MRAARDAGFDSFNLDLIYGAAGESLDDWRTTVSEALALDPPHISAYGLTIEPGTPLADEPDRHPDDDDQADKYVVADRVLVDHGLQSYEISNWSLPGHECKHNLLYWSQGEYLGIGCAAHSHRDGRRWWNVRTPDRYIDAITRGCAADRGVGASRRRRAAHRGPAARCSAPAPASLAARCPRGSTISSSRRAIDVVLTVRGRLLANEVALRLS